MVAMTGNIYGRILKVRTAFHIVLATLVIIFSCGHSALASSGICNCDPHPGHNDTHAEMHNHSSSAEAVPTSKMKCQDQSLCCAVPLAREFLATTSLNQYDTGTETAIVDILSQNFHTTKVPGQLPNPAIDTGGLILYILNCALLI